MKMIFRALVGLWVMVAAWSLSHWWQTHPDTPPNLPPSVWDWLSNLYGAKNAEQAADLVSIVAHAGSLVIVSAVTWLALFTYRRFFLRSIV